MDVTDNRRGDPPDWTVRRLRRDAITNVGKSGESDQPNDFALLY
jgi:hypothetical protein